MIAFAEPVSNANSIAERLTGRTYLSWSAISTYLKCPLKYQYHYLDQLPEEFVSSNLIFGSGIHAALEAFFRERLTAGQSLGIEALLAVYHESWNQTITSRVQFGKAETVTILGQLAKRMLQAFLSSELSQPRGSIIGIEEEYQAPVIADIPDLFARLDLIVENNDSLTVTDFKTARSRWSTAETNASEGQLLIYHELVRQVTDKPLRLQFAVITKTKLPEIELRSVDPDPQRIERTHRLIQKVWSGIQTGNFYPVPSAMNCPNCGYRDRCSRWPG
jgi:putative RecB family exonuclease